MTLAVLPFDATHCDAAVAFNARMRERQARSAFLLPERVHGVALPGPVSVTHFLALDGDGYARGGMLCQEYPARLGNATEPVLNISAPLSEGIVDPAFTFVGPLLIRHALRLNPHVFVVGMGHASNPLPRLLKAMKWRVTAVPFLFRLLRGGRCARHLRPLRTTRLKRLAADVAAFSGVAAAAPFIAHRPGRSSVPAKRFKAVPVEAWDARADAAWASTAPHVDFGVERSAAALPFFYRFDGAGPKAWWVTSDSGTVGWFGLAVTPMLNNPYFGNLTVATLTDCIGAPEAVSRCAQLAIQIATTLGADILIANIQDGDMVRQFQEAGWRVGPSNFLLGTSPALSGRFTLDRAYLTRRDGDGLANLA